MKTLNNLLVYALTGQRSYSPELLVYVYLFALIFTIGPIALYYLIRHA